MTVFGLLTTTTRGFTVPMIHPRYPQSTTRTQQPSAVTYTVLYLAAEKQQQQPQPPPLPDIDSMKATEMRKELESYGVSTKSLLEKSDFVQALQKAREEGMQPILVVAANDDDDDQAETKEAGSSSTTNSTTTTTTAATTTTTESTTTNAAESSTVNGESTTTSSSSSASKPSRAEIFQKAMEAAKSMTVGALRKELKDRGIPTQTFIEKSDFIKAYANAIADDTTGNKTTTTTTTNASSTSTTKGSTTAKKPEEPMDPSYRDVVTQKFDKRRLMGQAVIDIRIR